MVTAAGTIKYSGVLPWASSPMPPTEGKKKALLIGIKYSTPASDIENSDAGCSTYYAPPELIHPHKDVYMMRDLLIEIYGYNDDDITIMMDSDDISEDLQPTRDNIIYNMKQLVKGARSGDRFFFHYSGHGVQQECPDPDEEEDGKDECICTVDSKTITDNELKEILVHPLPQGSKLTAIFDCCHSGTILDLHTHCKHPKLPTIPRLAKIARVYILTRKFFRRKSSGSQSFSDTRIELTTRPSLTDLSRCDGTCQSKDSGAKYRGPTVICLSASQDDQFSWESNNTSMTQTLIKLLKSNPHPNLQNLHTTLSEKISALCRELFEKHLKKQQKTYYVIDQIPQISSLQTLNMNAVHWDP